MRLTIVTINYNGSENTIKLLESLKNQIDKGFDVFVVDNNSNSEEKAKLKNYRTEEANIVFMENKENLGFSGGNNVGIKRTLETWEADPAYSGASWILLLNNDAWIDNDFILHLRAVLEDKEGILGLAIDEGDRTAYAGLIEWFKPTLKHITDSKFTTSKMAYAIGGAMLIHKNVFDKIGFLDENYFLYFEDANFCQRARRAGIPISFLPEIKISHSVSASTKKLGSPMLLRYHYRNALYFNLKNGPFYVKILLWLWSLVIVLKQIVKVALNKNQAESKEILFGVVDFYRNKMGKIKTGS